MAYKAARKISLLDIKPGIYIKFFVSGEPIKVIDVKRIKLRTRTASGKPGVRNGRTALKIIMQFDSGERYQNTHLLDARPIYYLP